MSTPKQLPCPHCGKPCQRTADNPWRPFCSERCKLIDLGDWLDERYRVPEDTDHAGTDSY